MFWKLYFIALPLFLLIDGIWLGFVASSFYRDQIGFLMRENIDWLVALILYSLFVGGLVFFVIIPSIEKDSWFYALLAGSFFGLVSYAAYDLTNLATLKDWPLLVSIVDFIWGSVISSLVSVITYFLAIRLFF